MNVENLFNLNCKFVCSKNTPPGTCPDMMYDENMQRSLP